MQRKEDTVSPKLGNLMWKQWRLSASSTVGWVQCIQFATSYQVLGVEGGLPAQIIYEEILPKVVETLTSPRIPYVYGSPYGGEGWDTSSPTVGDVVSRYL